MVCCTASRLGYDEFVVVVVVLLEVVLLVLLSAVVVLGGNIIVFTIVDPEKTPTILTLEVSLMPSRAHRLLIYELITVFSKNCSVVMANLVVSSTVSSNST